MISNVEPLPQAPSSLDSRFFIDNGDWKDAPILKGQGSFTPVSRVRNILITGGAGFIASWLVRHLTLTYESSYNIFCFDKLDYCASLNNIRSLYGKKNFTFICGDVTNPAQVLKCLVAYRIDTIFHFAAQSHVDLSFGNSYRFTETNVCGTHVLLEAAKEVKIRRFIHVSTDEVYGEIHKDVGDVLEEARLAPTNPYSASKAAAEMYVNAYWKSYKLPAIIVRMNNVYGPHQYPEKVIPKFACLLDRDQKLVLQGDGSNSRKYIYAGDVADAFDTILHKGAVGQIYNVDSDDEITNWGLCARLLEIFKLPFETKEDIERFVEKGRDRPFNDMRYAVDGSKLRSLGWKPKTTFKEGLEKTVEWYQRWGDTWWGDISPALTPFPVIEGRKLVTEQHDELHDLVLFFQSLRQELDARDTALKDSLGQGLEARPSSKHKGWMPKLETLATDKSNPSSWRMKPCISLPLARHARNWRVGQNENNPSVLPRMNKGIMDVGSIDGNRVRNFSTLTISLIIVWLIAFQAPSQYEKVHERLPSLNVDWDPGRSPYNESKLALLVESRPLAHLTPLLLHMISVVPPEWRFLFLGSTASLNHTNISSTVQLHQASGKLKLREMPDVGLIHEQGKVDRILTNLTFYERYVDPAEWLLVFHTDSILCARSESTLNDWLEYDWVGGRRSLNDAFPGSGGLSLRRVSKLKEVLVFQDRQDDGDPEDRWFTGRISTMPDAKIASAEAETQFCVQDVFHETPMGYHISSGGTIFHPGVWLDVEQRKKIFEWCPEIKMILDMKFERERCSEDGVPTLSEADQEALRKAEAEAEERKKLEEEIKAAIKAELMEEIKGTIGSGRIELEAQSSGLGTPEVDNLSEAATTTVSQALESEASPTPTEEVGEGPFTHRI